MGQPFNLIERALANYILDPVSSTVVHSSGTVVATCSGTRSIPRQHESESGSDSDSESSQSELDSISDVSVSESDTQGELLETIVKSGDNSIKVWSL